ncbi:MAG: Flp pilus assembly protein ATPase CpaF [Microbacterium sp.]|jgi:hypothetical protein|uniref:hypothetical protein n=1 Tax=Microbacterium sp. TaxID=51671 RepID=UPI00262025BC|nr:hypothetical protein [Microbacterium sp.]MDF2558800.1 Flp pilus assembly protein ATPase CpaF [Microbacterium sp.]
MAHIPEDLDTTDDDDHGLVIVSLDVFSPSPIEALSAFEWTSEPRDDGWRYQLGTVSFDEPEADARADALDNAVMTLLDLLSEVPREVLFDDRAFVRLFLTFGRGAQTLDSSLVQRIAAVNGTIWIDS